MRIFLSFFPVVLSTIDVLLEVMADNPATTKHISLMLVSREYLLRALGLVSLMPNVANLGIIFERASLFYNSQVQCGLFVRVKPSRLKVYYGYSAIYEFLLNNFLSNFQSLESLELKGLVIEGNGDVCRWIPASVAV